VTHLRQIMLEELKRPNYARFDHPLVSDQTPFAGGRGFTLVQPDKVSTPAEPTGAGH
jgi:hypothetical protein